MPVTTIEAHIENGQIMLPPSARLPDHGQIFIIIPDTSTPAPAHIYSPKLANPQQATLLRKTMVEGNA